MWTYYYVSNNTSTNLRLRTFGCNVDVLSLIIRPPRARAYVRTHAHTREARCSFCWLSQLTRSWPEDDSQLAVGQKQQNFLLKRASRLSRQFCARQSRLLQAPPTRQVGEEAGRTCIKIDHFFTRRMMISECPIDNLRGYQGICHLCNKT